LQAKPQDRQRKTAWLSRDLRSTDPHALQRCGSRRWRPGLSRGIFSSSPLESAALAATPRSKATTSPVPGPGIVPGTTANAMCQRPARSSVTRWDFTPRGTDLDHPNLTQPASGIQISPAPRFSLRTCPGRTATIRSPRCARPFATQAFDEYPRRNVAWPGQSPSTPAAGPSGFRCAAIHAPSEPRSTACTAVHIPARSGVRDATTTAVRQPGSRRIAPGRNGL
jgi:hypothetical protein